MAFEIDFRLGEGKRQVRPLRTNAEIVEAWLTVSKARYAPESLINNHYHLLNFQEVLDQNGILATDMEPEDVWIYVDRFAQRCGSYTRSPGGDGSMYCRAKQDLAGCGFSCPLYEPVGFEVVKKHLEALNSLFRFLARRGHIKHNIVRDVKEQWLEENKHRHRPKKRRCPKRREVEILVNKTPAPNWKTLYALTAKVGDRRGEVMRLTVEPECLDLDEGWLEVPHARDKRKGNRRCPLDDETLRLLRWYLEWRDMKVKRDAEGRPVTNKLFISIRGTPLSPRTVESQIRRDCERLGINEPDAPKHKRITHHCLRHFFSDTLNDNGCPTYWWRVLRGESLKGTTEGSYNHIKDPKLREVYMQYRPRFTIIQPASYPVYGGPMNRGPMLPRTRPKARPSATRPGVGGAPEALTAQAEEVAVAT